MNTSPTTPMAGSESISTECIVYRCSRQPEMYLYLEVSRRIGDIPGALMDRLGRLSEVMRLSLNPQRRLARVEVTQVIAALRDRGFFVQMPPEGQVHASLYFGD